MTEARWAPLEMTAALCAMRPDWDENAVAGALAAAMTSGKSPVWAMTELCQAAGDPDGTPRDLTSQLRQAAPGVPPPAELLAELRADLATRDTGSEPPE